jgi:hypothetical protein
VLVTVVAVENLAFSEESRNLGDRKCLEDWGKSFVELPDAKQFLRIRGERLFQQPQDLSKSTVYNCVRSCPHCFGSSSKQESAFNIQFSQSGYQAPSF